MAGLRASDIRDMALAFPGAVEADHHGSPSFRRAGKIFCTLCADGQRMMVKLDLEDQYNLCDGEGGVITPVPGYWGRNGATYVVLSRIDRALADTLLHLAWARLASRKSAMR